MSVYLISRWIDPFFAAGVGVWAYTLYEREHPDERRAGHRLHELVAKRWKAYQASPAPTSVGK